MLGVTSTSSPTVDLAAVKGKQQAAWCAGDYAVVGTTLQIVGEMLCETLDMRAGEQVLDIAPGTLFVSVPHTRIVPDHVYLRPIESGRPPPNVREAGEGALTVSSSSAREVQASPARGHEAFC